MADYRVSSHLTDRPWQIVNQAREYSFTCDDMTTAPNPVEYFTGAVNSCIAMSAGMVAKRHDLDVRDFRFDTEAETKNLGHGLSKVVAMKVKVSFSSDMDKEEQQKFLDHVLHVSTVFQTVKDAVPIEVTLQ